MPVTSAKEYFDTLQARFVPEKAAGVDAAVQWQLDGEGGGDYYVELADGTLSVHEGKHPSPGVTFETTADNYVKIVNGELNGATALLTRKLKMSGSFALARQLAGILPNDG